GSRSPGNRQFTGMMRPGKGIRLPQAAPHRHGGSVRRRAGRAHFSSETHFTRGSPMPALHEPPLPGVDTTVLFNVLTPSRKGDFSVRLPVEWTGAAGKVADALNEVIERNERLTQELARLSRVVGKQGKIHQRASLGDVQGAWAEAVESVNELVGDLA